MQRLEIDVPDDLAETLAPYRDRLADVLRIGLRAIEARQTEQQRAGDDQPACAPSTEIPPLVARLDQFRGSLSGARTFDDSADAIREERDRRAAAL